MCAQRKMKIKSANCHEIRYIHAPERQNPFHLEKRPRELSCPILGPDWHLFKPPHTRYLKTSYSGFAMNHIHAPQAALTPTCCVHMHKQMLKGQSVVFGLSHELGNGTWIACRHTVLWGVWVAVAAYGFSAWQSCTKTYTACHMWVHFVCSVYTASELNGYNNYKHLLWSCITEDLVWLQHDSISCSVCAVSEKINYVITALNWSTVRLQNSTATLDFKGNVSNYPFSCLG